MNKWTWPTTERPLYRPDVQDSYLSCRKKVKAVTEDTNLQTTQNVRMDTTNNLRRTVETSILQCKLWKWLAHTAVVAVADVTERVIWCPLASYHVISALGLLDVVLQVRVKRSPATTESVPDIATPCGGSVFAPQNNDIHHCHGSFSTDFDWYKTDSSKRKLRFKNQLLKWHSLNYAAIYRYGKVAFEFWHKWSYGIQKLATEHLEITLIVRQSLLQNCRIWMLA